MLNRIIKTSLYPNSKVRNVRIVGGTHGNEFSGIEIVKYLNKNVSEIERKSLSVKALVSNFEAVAVNQRYVDTDLNRCFDLNTLKRINQSSDESLNTEERIAKGLNKFLGPKGDAVNVGADFIMDLHNTTARTATLLCFHETDTLSLEVGAFLGTRFDEVSLNLWMNTTREEAPFLPSLGKSGMTVELGPLAHSTFSLQLFERTKDLISSALDYLELRNTVDLDSHSNFIDVEVETAKRIAVVKFPRDEKGNISAFVNADEVVGKNTSELLGAPRITRSTKFFREPSGGIQYLDFDSLGITNDQINKGIYALFVNEASYYEKDVACYLVTKVPRTVRILDYDSVAQGQSAPMEASCNL